MASSSGDNCPHCERELSKKTFEAHKRLYYDRELDQWIKKQCLIPSEHKNALATSEVALEGFDPIDDDKSDKEDSDFDRPPLIELGDESDNSLEEKLDLCSPQEACTFDEEGK